MAACMLPHHYIAYNDVCFTEILKIVTLSMSRCRLPDDGHRPKHLGAFYYEFSVNFIAFED